MMIRSRFGLCRASVLALLAVGLVTSVLGVSSAGAATGPKRGGIATLGAWQYSLIDPGAPGYNNTVGPDTQGFGVINSAAAPRNIQLSLHFIF